MAFIHLKGMCINMKIAIDGPSGAGKSTLAKAVARELGIIYVDTGALYRAVGLYVSRAGFASNDRAGAVSCLDKIKIEMRCEGGEQKVYLNGEDVNGLIRTPEISKYASDVSAIPEVRAFLLDMQKDIAAKNSVVMDGRDIGTVIMPDADVKIFLTASMEERAHRRYLENIEKGVKCSESDIYANMKERDKNDSTREVAPAVAAPDAVMFDNSGFVFEETLKKALDIIKEKTEKDN